MNFRTMKISHPSANARASNSSAEIGSTTVKFTRRLGYYRCPLDESDQPFLVCAPVHAEMDAEREPAFALLPVIYFLHDTLSDPTPEGFIESAFREAAAWLPVLESGPPVLFVQPFGRGNAGWLGLGAGDLAAVEREVARRYPLDADAVTLLGLGAGATGALQNACWYPDRWAAVAALGAWSNPRLDLPLGSNAWPEWEQGQRRAISPWVLARNLASIPLWLENPIHHQGLGGTAAPAHTTALSGRLRTLGISTATIRPAPALAAPNELHRAALLHWLLEQRRQTPTAFSFTTYNLAAPGCQGVEIARLAKPGFPAQFLAQTVPTSSGNQLRLRTKGVDSLFLHAACRWPGGLVFNGQYFSLHEKTVKNSKETTSAPNESDDTNKKSPPDQDTVFFERVGQQWRQENLAHPSMDSLLQTSYRCSPLWNLHRGGILFVAGSLGDEHTNAQLLLLAQELRDRWQQGVESANPYPGSRVPALAYRAVRDVDLTADELARNHLVLVGTPVNHLYLARWRNIFPCSWSDGSLADDDQAPNIYPKTSIRFLGRTWQHENDGVLLLAPHPDNPRRLVLLITATTLAAFATVPALSYLPDYLVWRGSQARAWGYWGPDWQPIANASFSS